MNLETEKVTCRKCGAEVDELAVFPGKLCLACHATKFDAQVAKTGVLPRPTFGRIFGRK